MDLRKRLVKYLGILLAGLFAMALLVNLYSLRSDIDAEVAASERLVKILLDASNQAPRQAADETTAHLRRLIESAPLRHLKVSVEPPGHPAEQVRIGQQTLYIAPNPESEIDERLGDMIRLGATLLLFSGATLLVAWWAADRALSPVRELEAGLHRLAHGAPDPALPPFELREFRQVASAIDQLASALASARAAQKQLARQLIEVQEDERRTLARELHDETGQTLTAIGVTAAFLERNAATVDSQRIAECAGEIRRDVRTTGEQLRAMLKRLRPHGMDAEGVAGALRELLASWQQRTVDIDFRLEMPARLPALTETQALVLYRVVQEALTNVVRHSAARHCTVQLRPEGGVLHLQIDDDGKGLPAGDFRRGGLLGMQERLEMVNGSLTLASASHRGLRLQITLPLAEQEKETS